MIPPYLIFVVLLIVPLRVSAMEPFFDAKNGDNKKSFSNTAAMRYSEHERLATAPDQDDSTSSAVDPSVSSGAVDSIIPEELGTLAIQNLECDNKIASQALYNFIHLTRSRKTMACLQAINFGAVPDN